MKLVESDQTGNYETNRVGGQGGQGCTGYEDEDHEGQSQRPYMEKSKLQLK